MMIACKGCAMLPSSPYSTAADCEDICRKHSISNATYYNWKSKYGGMEVSDIKKMRELQEENDKLKKNVRRSQFGKCRVEGADRKKGW